MSIRLEGIAPVLFGLVLIVGSKKWGKSAAKFHRRVEKRLPWLYWLPPANMATSDDGESVWYLFGGVCFVVLGSLALAGVMG